jgi:hypothetical protein
MDDTFQLLGMVPAPPVHQPFPLPIPRYSSQRAPHSNPGHFFLYVPDRPSNYIYAVSSTAVHMSATGPPPPSCIQSQPASGGDNSTRSRPRAPSSATRRAP